jgi:hypothetical protein
LSGKKRKEHKTKQNKTMGPRQEFFQNLQTLSKRDSHWVTIPTISRRFYDIDPFLPIASLNQYML